MPVLYGMKLDDFDEMQQLSQDVQHRVLHFWNK